MIVAAAPAPPPTTTSGDTGSSGSGCLARRLARIREADRGPRLADRRAHQVPPHRVGGLEGRRQGLGLLRRLGQQEARGVERLPHPPGGVEPRRQHEAHRLEVHGRRRDTGPREEGGDPGPRGRTHELQAQAGDRAVLAQDRCDVRDRPDGGEVRQLERLRLGAGEVAQEQPCHGERDPAPGELGVRVDGVGAVRVDQRHCGRQHVGQVVMVRDQDVDPAPGGRGHLRDARGARVHRHDQRDPGLGRRGDRRHRDPVALLEPGRHVRDHVQAEPAQGEDQLRQAGQAVRVEVPEDHDALPARRGPGRPARPARPRRAGGAGR